MNSVLLSIQPKWCELIASGKKTIEVRKTKPKLDTPFKCYIYCTEKELLTKSGRTGGIYVATSKKYRQVLEKVGNISLSGKVIGEFVCDYITTIFFDSDIRYGEDFPDRCISSIDASCLSLQELKKYSNGNDIYGWYISDLIIYDEPRELSEFYFPPELYCEKERCGGCPKDQVADCNGEYAFDCEWQRPLTRPPMSWCYIAPPGGECL